MKKRFFVSMSVVYTTSVTAESKEEAIELAMAECEYDVDAGTEPFVKQADGEFQYDSDV